MLYTKRMHFSAIFLLSILGAAHAFNVAYPSRFTQSKVTRFMSEPSDTSFDRDTVVSIDSEPYIPTESEALVTSVLDKLNGLSGEVTSETRAAINEILLQLEPINPTKNPTMSPLLNGVWELRYAAGYASDWALPSPTR
jgi:PAP_fibrillin